MGKCVFCDENAGMFRNMHDECEPIRRVVCQTLMSGREFSDMRIWIAESIDAIQQIRQRSYSVNDVEGAIMEGWCDAVDLTLRYGVITDEEERRLSDFELFGDDIDEEQIYQMAELNPRFRQRLASMGMAVAAKEVKKGNYSTGESIRINEPRMPFNLQKSEKLVSIIPHVEYYEERTRVDRSGRYGGASFRVASGLYLHGGGYRSRPVDVHELEHLDMGLLGVTTKHLYFSGGRKKFRISYDRLVTYEHNDDTLIVMRDAASANPQLFVTGDGLLTYNLVDAVINYA